MSSDELVDDTEFLQREQELMGDEFKTEQDNELLFDQDLEQEQETKDTATSFDETGKIDNQVDNDQDDLTDLINNDTSVNEATVMNNEAEKIISDWKTNYESDIAQRDEKANLENNELQEAAIKFIDNFYDKYNATKEEKLESIKLQNDKFIEERDSFFQQDNTIWDRALQLINLDDSDVVGDRDRSKFKQILLKLKGNVNAPGVN